MSYENFDPKDLLIQSFETNPSGFVHRIPHGIRAVHLPTGTVVVCDADRSQHRNRHLALTHLWDMVQGKPTYQELLAQVEALKLSDSELHALVEDLIDHLRYNKRESTDVLETYWDRLSAIQTTQISPQQHLAELRAEAVLDAVSFGRNQTKYFLRSSEDILQQIEQYADSIRQEVK